jgi:hypothetical protein
VRGLQNLVHELKRLESGLLFLREEAWRNFEQSLDLPALGLAEGYLTKTIKGPLLRFFLVDACHSEPEHLTVFLAAYPPLLTTTTTTQESPWAREQPV